MNRAFIIIGFIFACSTAFSQEMHANKAEHTDTNLTIKQHISERGNICAWIPLRFTPNRDGIDDEWCIKTSGANKIHYKIWIRDGVFIKNQTWYIDENTIVCLWDFGIGSSRKDKHELETYFFQITLTNESTGESIEINGTVVAMY